MAIFAQVCRKSDGPKKLDGHVEELKISSPKITKRLCLLSLCVCIPGDHRVARHSRLFLSQLGQHC